MRVYAVRPCVSAGGVRGVSFVSGGFLPEKQRGTHNEEYIHVCDCAPYPHYLSTSTAKVLCQAMLSHLNCRYMYYIIEPFAVCAAIQGTLQVTLF